MRQVSTLMGIFLLFSMAGGVSAQTVDLNSYSCGVSAIKLGMTAEQIKADCGTDWQPVFISKHDRPAFNREDENTSQMDHFEKWMYQPVGEQATHVLLKNGEVIRIFTNATATASQ